MIQGIRVYLITNGNGLEAVRFYEDVFNASVDSCVTWKDQIPDCPKEREHLVMNAQLNVDGILLMLSDENPDYTYKQGTNMSASIMMDNADEAKQLFEKLSKDAQTISMPIQETFWSPAYGIVIDKFGIQWQVNTEV